jgi:ketosteroid isomerase-like protein
VGESLPERLVAAISAQDSAGITACFAEDASLRALIPPGTRERTGATEAAALIASWFTDSTVLELTEVSSKHVGDRLHIAYCFTGVEDDEPFVVEQHLYCTVADGRIERADLLCSGFRPPRTA